MTIMSAPVSILNSVWLLLRSRTVHGWLLSFTTATSEEIVLRKDSSPVLEVTSELLSEISAIALDRHTDLKCPFLEQQWQVASLAGHCWRGYVDDVSAIYHIENKCSYFAYMVPSSPVPSASVWFCGGHQWLCQWLSLCLLWQLAAFSQLRSDA